MRLIVITPEEFLPDEGIALNQLFREGLETLHLRKPPATRRALETLLNEIAPAFHRRIVLHDHFELALGYRLKGIHLNRRNPSKPEGWLGSTSRSCHSLAELQENAGLDYQFLSPLFDSVSKQGYRQAFSATDLVAARQEGVINEKVIALGGITEETLPKAAAYGFGGVAVIGALWHDFNKNRDTDSLADRFLRLRTLCDQS